MANEGSTKPTYSELEELRRIKAVRGQHDCDCEVCSTVSRVCPASASSYALEIIGLRAENLRVRGLLQRQLDFAKVLRRIHHGHQVTIGGKLYVTAHTLIDYAKGYEKGAESAGIGKLDTADKEAAKGLAESTNLGFDEPTDADLAENNFYTIDSAESGVEMGKVNRVTSHCIGTFWKDDEIAVISDLSRRKEMSHVAVLREALRLYQIHVLGVPDLGEKALPLNDQLDKLFRPLARKIVREMWMLKGNTDQEEEHVEAILRSAMKEIA